MAAAVARRQEEVEQQQQQQQQLHIEYLYIAHDTFADPSVERHPKIDVWTSLPRVRGTRGHPIHQRLLPEASDLVGDDPSRNPVARVAFPYDAGEVQQRGMSVAASVHFLLLTQVQSGATSRWCYEQTAAAKVPLAGLMAAAQGQHDPQHDVEGAAGDVVQGWRRVPMKIYSFYMLDRTYATQEALDADRSKGEMWVRLAGPSARKWGKPGTLVRWAKPTGFEAVPAHAPSLMAATGLAVARTMSVLDPDVMAAAAAKTTTTTTQRSNPFPAITHKIAQVHAIVFKNEGDPVPMPGYTYWSMIPLVAAEHVRGQDPAAARRVDDYLATLLRQSLARHDMTAAEFVAASHSTVFQGGTDSRVTPRQVRTACAALAGAAGMRGPGFVDYVRDTVPLGGRDHRLPTVESFNDIALRTDDDRDMGGVRSWLMMAAGGSESARRRLPVAAVRGPVANTASGGAGDCEDSGHDGAMHFVMWRERGIVPSTEFRHPINEAARTIAQSYRAVGILSSVMHRNLADAKSKSSGPSPPPPLIGDPLDEQEEVGAHMFTLLISEKTLRRGVNKALLARKMSEQDVTVDFGTHLQGPSANAHVSPEGHPIRLPVLLLEGTGMLDPLPLTAEYYARKGGPVARVRAATRSAMGQEAEVRLRTGITTREVLIMSQQHEKTTTTTTTTSGKISDALAAAGFTTMHTQEKLVEDPDERFIPHFYQTISEVYVVPTLEQAEDRRQTAAAAHEAQPRLRSRRRLSGDLMYAVQIGERFQGGRDTGRVEIPAQLSDGVDLSDLMRHRDFVGFLPTPEPHPHELAAVESLRKHMAPTLPLELAEGSAAAPYEARGRASIQAFRRSTAGMRSARRAMEDKDGRLVMVHAYASSVATASDGAIRSLGQSLRQNPHVRGASLEVERTTYHLVGLRLDVAIDTSGEGTEIVPRVLAQMMEAKKAELSQRVMSAYAAAAAAAAAANNGGGGKSSEVNRVMPHCRTQLSSSSSSWKAILSGHLFPATTTTVLSERGYHNGGYNHHHGTGGGFRLIEKPASRPFFEDATVTHIRLTRTYALASYGAYADQHHRGVPSLSSPEVQALVRQFDVWGRGFREAVDKMSRPAQLLKSVKALSEKGTGVATTPWDYWTNSSAPQGRGLIFLHTVYAKNLADNTWPGKNAEGARAEALANITDNEPPSGNLYQISLFLQLMLRYAPHYRRTAGAEACALWVEHLECTDRYFMRLHTHKRPRSELDETHPFNKEFSECLESGRQFGRVLDHAFWP